MAEPKEIHEDNVGGYVIAGGRKVSFYVDQECILCSVCSDAAPNNFRMSDMEDHDICYKQPESEEELEQCLEAMDNCPVTAIGTNGVANSGLNKDEIYLDHKALLDKLNADPKASSFDIERLASHLLEEYGDEGLIYLNDFETAAEESADGIFGLI